MPRHGICGTGRSYSSGGPPCTLSLGVGLRKNKRGSRSLRLKLEVDEGIAASLRKNDRAGHQGPCRGHDPARQTRYGGFDVALAQRPMHENHADSNDTDLQHFAGGKNGVAVYVSAEHAVQHSGGDGEIGRAKKHPGDADGGVGGETGQKFRGKVIRPRCLLEENANDAFDYEIGTVKQTPNHKSPGRAVPEPAEEHDDNQIDRGANRADLIAAERNVKVISQECGKRDVPATPEVGKANGRVGKTEIVLEMKTEAKSRADGADGIAGEIEKYLAGEGHDAEPRIERNERTGVTKNAIGRTGQHRVGEHNFFKQAQRHEQ